MLEPVHPAFILIVGGLLYPLIGSGKPKQVYLLLLPVIAAANLYLLPDGSYWNYGLMDYTLTLGRVDALSRVFAYAFLVIAFCAILYGLHVKEDGHQMAACMYAGSALGVVFAGDLITLYIFWEVMAVASAFLIFYRRTEAAVGAGMRYLMVHAAGGICLLAGIVMYVHATGSYAFNSLDYGIPGTVFILLGFLINAAVPPLHAWLPDAYPEATITGIIFLMAFTTKSAVYVLIRGFTGFEILMWLGAMMAVYGVVFAMLQNDIRRLLSYHIISQVGYMVAGVGMGTYIALNGSIAHAFNNVLFKGLLLMCAGAIIYATGKSRFTELGGLYRAMPLTAVLFMIGALSISGVPLFNGFTSKPMIMSAAGELQNSIVYALLVGAGVGTFLCIGLKIPYLAFTGDSPGLKVRQPPLNMKLAMGIIAALCILIGLYPQALYGILPYDATYAPYTPGHVIGEVQLLLFTAWGFLMLRTIIVPKSDISLDFDLFYRIPGKALLWFINNPVANASSQIAAFFTTMKEYMLWFLRNPQTSAAIFIQLLYPGNSRISGSAEQKALQRVIHRGPIGDSVTLTLVFTSIYTVYYIIKGGEQFTGALYPILAWVVFGGVMLIAAAVFAMLFVMPAITFAIMQSRKINRG